MLFYFSLIDNPERKEAENVKLTFPVSESRDHIQGPTNAAVTLVEYGDYECPYCAQAYLIVKEVQERLGRKLRFVFRNFPLTGVRPRAYQSSLSMKTAMTNRGILIAFLVHLMRQAYLVGGGLIVRYEWLF